TSARSKLVQTAETLRKWALNAPNSLPLDVVGCGRSSLPSFGFASDEKDAQVDHHPWMAFLIHKEGLICPSILIPTWKANSSFAVVTSSWCHRQGRPSDMRVVTGVGRDGQINGTYSQISMVAASFQSSTNHSDDVAFVFFTPEVTFNDHVKPVCLPRQGQPPPKSPCALTGWKAKRTKRDAWEHALKSISKVQLKETLLMAKRMKIYTSGGNRYFSIKDTFNKTGKTHFIGSPLVCRHQGLWTLYGINIPGLAKKRRSTFMDLYDKLHSIQDEVQLPVGK
ncbi:hypothetical protein M513_13869, partial [Trichuris suis]